MVKPRISLKVYSKQRRIGLYAMRGASILVLTLMAYMVGRLIYELVQMIIRQGL